MNIEDNARKPQAGTAASIFLWAFLLRLLYGLLGLPIVAVVVPPLFHEKRHMLLGLLAFYLLICVAGSAYDTARGIRRGFQKPRMLDFLCVGISVASLIILWLRR